MPSLSEKQLLKLQVLVLGDMNVGKTALITRFMFDTYETGYYPTFGIDFLTKMLYTTEHVVRLQFWDTAGRKCFESLIPTYVRDTRLAVIVYDVTKRSTFTQALDWVQRVRAEHGQDCFIVLAANKSDLATVDRQVSREEAEAKAAEIDVVLSEVSAQSGIGVKAMFDRVVRAGIYNLTNATDKDDDESGEAGEKSADGAPLELPKVDIETPIGAPVTACCSDVFGGLAHFVKHTVFGQRSESYL